MIVIHGDGRAHQRILRWLLACMSVFVCTCLNQGIVSGAEYQETYIEDAVSEDHYDYTSNGFGICVSAGYQGVMRLGRDIDFTVTIGALESEFDGIVSISVPDAQGDTLSYSKEVDIEKGERKEVTFTIQMINEWSGYSVEIKDGYKGNLFYKVYDIQASVDMDTPYFGFLSNSPDCLSYCKPEKSVDLRITDTELPRTISDWGIFDYVVVDNYDLSSLGEECFSNLMEWVKQGGTLILGTGQAYEKTVGYLAEKKILDVTYEGAAIQNTQFGMTGAELIQLKQNTKASVGLSSQRLSLEVRKFSVKGSKILRKENTTLIESVDYQEGNIILYHIELGKKEIKNNIISVLISQSVLDYLSNQRKAMLEDEIYDNNVTAYRMNVVKEGNDVVPPSIWSYIFLILVYLIVSGPLLYWILTKINRQKLIWIVLPILTITFLGLVFIDGSKSRMTNVKASYFSSIQYKEDEVEEDIVFNLTVPYYDEFQMCFDSDTKIQAVNDKDYGYYLDTYHQLEENGVTDYKRLISNQADSNWISLQEMAPYSSKYFNAIKKYKPSGTYDSNLKFTPKGYEGSVSNNLGFDLEDAFLIGNGCIAYLGEIKDKAEGQVRAGEGRALLTADYFSVSDYVEQSLSQNQGGEMVSEKSSAVNYFIQTFFEKNQEKQYVIGCTNSNYSEGITGVLKKQTDCSGIGLVILPIESNSQSNGEDFVFSLGNDYSSLEGAYSSNTLYRYFTGTIVLEYQLPKEDAIKSLYYSKFINSEFDIDTYCGFTGMIYLYNRRTGMYDSVFNTYDSVVTDLTDYLSSSNKLIVKYQEKNDMNEYYMNLPYISYYKEAK